MITHEKVLVDCEAEFDEFIERMQLLGDKLGPLVLQFPFFNTNAFKTGAEFLGRLRPCLGRVKDRFNCRFVVEIRNNRWIDERLLDALRENSVALALIDQSWMPRPWEMKKPLDLITADFTYVRWLGDRKGIEEQTKTWDKTVVDREMDIREWVSL